MKPSGSADVGGTLVTGAFVGVFVGADVTGASVGAFVGADVTGASVGVFVGADVTGASVGAFVVADVTGAFVGTLPVVTGAVVGAFVRGMFTIRNYKFLMEPIVPLALVPEYVVTVRLCCPTTRTEHAAKLLPELPHIA